MKPATDSPYRRVRSADAAEHGVFLFLAAASLVAWLRIEPFLVAASSIPVA